MELFTLLGKIAIDDGESIKALDSISDKVQGVRDKIESFGEGMQSFGDKVTDIGKSWTAKVTTGISALGIASWKSASTFEDAMAKVTTIMDESEMSVDDMRRAILDLSDQTGISSAAIAEDVYNAISAGQSTAEAVNFVSKSTKLAKAGFAETSQSLDVLTTIMNAYEMEAQDVTRVSDILIQTQNLGKTTVGDLSSSMGKVIPTAKSYNVSLEQIASAYTITTAKGIATAESTTYINSMLNELGKSGTKVSDTLKAKTGKSFSELMNEGYSLGDCLEIVQQAAAEQNLAFNDMWGSAEAAKAGVTLLGDSAEAFNSRLAEMNNVTGSTDAAFEKLETSSYKTQKAINEAKNVLVDLGGVIIEILLPYIEKGAEKVHEFAEWFKNLDDGTKKLIVTVGGIAAAVGPVLIVGGKVISGAGQIISGISGIIGVAGKLSPMIGTVVSGGGKVVTGIGSLVAKLGGGLLPALAAVPAPVWIIIAVIGALVAAGVVLYKHWDEVKEFASKAWGAIKDTVAAAGEKIKGFFSGILDFFRNNWQGLLLLIVNPIAGGFKLLYDNCEGFRNFIDGFLEGIKTAFTNFFSNIGEKAHELKENISNKFHEMKDNVSAKIEEIKENASAKFAEIKENIGSKVEEIRENASAKFSEMKENISSRVEEIKENASAKFAELKENISSRVEEMKENAVAKINDMREKVAAGFQHMKEAAAEKFNDLKERWTSKFEETREKMVSEATEMKEKVGERLEEFKAGAIEKIEAFKSGAVQKFTEMRDNVTSKISDVIQKGVSGFNEIREKGGAAINSLKETAFSRFTEMAESIGSKFSAIADKVTSIFSGARDNLAKIVETVKGFFNFEWKLPEIKLPHFSMDGEFSLNPPSIPHFGVEWYAKAMDEPMIMTSPTAFGINPAGQLMAGGEAGSEVVSGTNTLMRMISSAVAASNGQTENILMKLYELLSEYLPALSKMQICLDTGTLVGELAAPLNNELGWIAHSRERRN